MDLNATKPQFRELAPLFGLTLLTLLPIFLGGALFLWAIPRSEYSASGWNWLGMLCGGLLALAGLRYFWPLSATVPTAVQRYYTRIDDWHYAQITKFEESDGRIQATQVTEWHLMTTDARHMLLLLLYVHLTGKTPSIRSLTEGPLLVRANHRAYSLGVISQDQASEALALLASAGVLLDRSPRNAGRLAVMDFKQAAQKVLMGLSRDPRVLDAEATTED